MKQSPPKWRLTACRADRVRKSVGAENTFAADLFAFDVARDALQPILDKVWRCCENAGTHGRTVTLKVKYADFQQITRSRTAAASFATRAELEWQSFELLAQLFPVAKGVRLLGVSLSSLDETRMKEKPQLSLGSKFVGGARHRWRRMRRALPRRRDGEVRGV